jgi:hypothetical protein
MRRIVRDNRLAPSGEDGRRCAENSTYLIELIGHVFEIGVAGGALAPQSQPLR